MTKVDLGRSISVFYEFAWEVVSSLPYQRNFLSAGYTYRPTLIARVCTFFLPSRVRYEHKSSRIWGSETWRKRICFCDNSSEPKGSFTSKSGGSCCIPKRMSTTKTLELYWLAFIYSQQQARSSASCRTDYVGHYAHSFLHPAKKLVKRPEPREKIPRLQDALPVLDLCLRAGQARLSASPRHASTLFISNARPRLTHKCGQASNQGEPMADSQSASFH